MACSTTGSDQSIVHPQHIHNRPINIPSLTLPANTQMAQVDRANALRERLELNDVEVMIKNVQSSIEQLNGEFAGNRNPNPLYLENYHKLTNKLHNLQEKRDALLQRESIQSTSSIVDSGLSPGCTNDASPIRTHSPVGDSPEDLSDVSDVFSNSHDHSVRHLSPACPSDQHPSRRTSSSSMGRVSPNPLNFSSSRKSSFVTVHLPYEQRSTIELKSNITLRVSLAKAMAKRNLNIDLCSVTSRLCARSEANDPSIMIDWDTLVTELNVDEIWVIVRVPNFMDINHRFVRKTYFSLTFCDQCSRAIWLQGFRCQICGTKFHQRCWSLVPQQCEQTSAMTKFINDYMLQKEVNPDNRPPLPVEYDPYLDVPYENNSIVQSYEDKMCVQPDTSDTIEPNTLRRRKGILRRGPPQKALSNDSQISNASRERSNSAPNINQVVIRSQSVAEQVEKILRKERSDERSHPVDNINKVRQHSFDDPITTCPVVLSPPFTRRHESVDEGQRRRAFVQKTSELKRRERIAPAASPKMHPKLRRSPVIHISDHAVNGTTSNEGNRLTIVSHQQLAPDSAEQRSAGLNVENLTIVDQLKLDLSTAASKRRQSFMTQKKNGSMEDYVVPQDAIVKSKKIGSGSFGTVYKGTWFGDVAIKEMNVQTPTKSQKEAFKSEMKLLKEVRHTHILMFCAWIDDPQMAIITNWCDGGSLYKHLHVDCRRFTTNQLARIGNEVAQAMGYLHAKDIIHRDLKSNNILFDGDSTRIADFGLATVKSRWDGSKRQKQPTGSILWMAPEVIKMQSDDPYTYQSDVYSFGVVMFEMLSSELPYAHSNKDQIFYMVGVGRLKPDFTLPRIKDYPKILVDLAQKCCNYQRDLRPSFTEIQKIFPMVQTPNDPRKSIHRSSSEPSIPSAQLLDNDFVFNIT